MYVARGSIYGRRIYELKRAIDDEQPGWVMIFAICKSPYANSRNVHNSDLQAPTPLCFGKYRNGDTRVKGTASMVRSPRFRTILAQSLTDLGMIDEYRALFSPGSTLAAAMPFFLPMPVRCG